MTRSRKRTASPRNNAGAAESSPIRILRVRKDDDLKTLYAKARKAFTAGDLQRYTRDEEMMPAQQLVEEFEAEERRERKRRVKQN
jgi:hypothetical protein